MACGFVRSGFRVYRDVGIGVRSIDDSRSLDEKGEDMARIAVWAKIPAAPGKRDDLAKALETALETAKGESGTVYYILHADATDENALFMYEMYEDQSALDLHMGSEAFKALGPAIRPFLGGAPELSFLSPLGGKGA